MNKVLSALILLSAFAGSVYAQYFPTGMKWEEVNVDPEMELEYENAHIYEIGADTLVGNVTYKKVLKDNEFSGICVRESGDKVWLLTKEYPTEFLLYDFDWDDNKEIETEYLKNLNIEGNDYALQKETIPMDKCQDVTINGKTYQYYSDSFIRSQIRGIGKVAELNRYPCLLGYKEMAEILPGLVYSKVHWIQRNGEEIFRSDYAKEWTSEVPGGSKTDINMAYHPFVKEGKVWNCQVKGYESEKVDGVYAFYFQTAQYSLRINGDTIIDGITYKKIYKENEIIDKILVQTDPADAIQSMEKNLHLEKNVTTLYPEFMREEGKTVYGRWKDWSNQEFILYDFSVAEGEKLSNKFPLGEVLINSISTITAHGQSFRCFHLGPNYGYEPLWVEGIGHPGGPFLSADAMMNDGKSYTLLSCYEDGTCIFTADDFKLANTIKSIQSDVRHAFKIYDLQGRRLSKEPAHGVYIQNGRKRIK